MIQRSILEHRQIELGVNQLFSEMRRELHVASSTGGPASHMVVNAVLFLLPSMLQLSFGLDAYVSGPLILCVFAGNVAVKLFTSAIILRF